MLIEISQGSLFQNMLSSSFLFLEKLLASISLNIPIVYYGMCMCIAMLCSSQINTHCYSLGNLSLIILLLSFIYIDGS
jgi:hypothetical protein